MLENARTIRKYLREEIVTRNGNRVVVPFALLLAVEYEGEILIGYSMAHPSDSFDKEIAAHIAVRRAAVLADRLDGFTEVRVTAARQIQLVDQYMDGDRVRSFRPAISAELPAFLEMVTRKFPDSKLVPWAARIRELIPA